MSATKKHIIDNKSTQKYCNPCIWNGRPVIIKYKIMELEEKDELYKQPTNTMIELISDMNWYDRTLLQEYYKCNKNAKRLSRLTKISYMNIWRRLNKLKQNGKFELFNYPEFFKIK
jgi:hypothetical protein